MMFITRKRSLFLASLLITTPWLPAAELLTNGDFQAGNTGFLSNYTYNSGDVSSAQTYDITSNPHNDHSAAYSYFDHTKGDSTGQMMVVNGSTNDSTIAWSNGIRVVNGGNYTFSFWASEWSDVGNNANLKVYIQGQQIQSDEIPGYRGETGVLPDVAKWHQYSFNWTADARFANILIIDSVTASNGNDFALDDLSFTGPPAPVPTPTAATAGLLLLSLLALPKLLRRASQIRLHLALDHGSNLPV